MYEVEEYFHRSEYQFYDIIELCPDLDYVYEFGVYGGKTMLDLLRQAFLNGKPVKNFFGFDTFTGLPDADSGHKDWTKGAFSASKLFNKGPFECEHIVKTLGALLFPSTNIHITRSTFNKIEKWWELKPASFVHIDCDIYTSTLDALEFMRLNNLLKVGTVIRYDDFVLGSDWNKVGEGLAHETWRATHNIQCKRYDVAKSIFIIENI